VLANNNVCLWHARTIGALHAQKNSPCEDGV